MIVFRAHLQCDECKVRSSVVFVSHNIDPWGRPVVALAEGQLAPDGWWHGFIRNVYSGASRLWSFCPTHVEKGKSDAVSAHHHP